jgi:hypothetical protein
MWHAHIAMQQAKSTQGCTFHIFNERINRNARSLADLESELRRACAAMSWSCTTSHA